MSRLMAQPSVNNNNHLVRLATRTTLMSVDSKLAVPGSDSKLELQLESRVEVSSAMRLQYRRLCSESGQLGTIKSKQARHRFPNRCRERCQDF